MARASALPSKCRQWLFARATWPTRTAFPADRRVQDPSSCHALIADAGQRLLDAEKDSGRIRPDVQIDELITLAMAISTLRDPDARNRLRGIVVNGWGSPSGGE